MYAIDNTDLFVKNFLQTPQKFFFDIYQYCFKIYGATFPFSIKQFSVMEYEVTEDLYVEVIELPKTELQHSSFLKIILIIDGRSETGTLYITTLEQSKEQGQVIFSLDLDSYDWTNEGKAPETQRQLVENILYMMLNEEFSVCEYVQKECPICGITLGLRINTNEVKGYESFLHGENDLEDALPALNLFEREFLITGICPDCQCSIFQKKLPEDISRWIIGDDFDEDE